MKIIKMIGVVALIVGALYFVASDEQRGEIKKRLEQAGQIGVSDRGTPKVVREQRRKESFLQDNTWTAENRALHPLEYCQAMLSELATRSQVLEGRVHDRATTLAGARRMLGDDEAMEIRLKAFIIEAKDAYRECEAKNSWPAKLGGYSLSKQNTEDKIIDSSLKLAEIQSRTVTRKNQIVQIEKSIEIARGEQQRIVKIRSRIESTINDLKLKKVIDADDGVKAAIDAIDDSLGDLGVDYDNPSVESIVQPDTKANRAELFKKIMSE